MIKTGIFESFLAAFAKKRSDRREKLYANKHWPRAKTKGSRLAAASYQAKFTLGQRNFKRGRSCRSFMLSK